MLSWRRRLRAPWDTHRNGFGRRPRRREATIDVVNTGPVSLAANAIEAAATAGLATMSAAAALPSVDTARLARTRVGPGSRDGRSLAFPGAEMRFARAAALAAMSPRPDLAGNHVTNPVGSDWPGPGWPDRVGGAPGQSQSLPASGAAPSTHASAARPRSSIVNAFTVDVEDWFQIAGFADVISPKQWPQFPPRLDRNLDLMLRLLDRHQVKASFFVSGWIIDRHPDRVREIARLGHEVGSRGLSHERIVDLGPDRFRAELLSVRHRLEELTGQPVIGYRAPDFSLTRETPWAHPIIAQCGYQYSSSVFPIVHDRYGLPGAPRFPYIPCDGLLEIPPSTFHALGRTLPAGGGYFRFYPYRLTAWALRRINENERSPAVFYAHPWAIDVRQPRVRKATLASRVRHYTNLDRTLLRLDQLLSDFQWAPMSQVFGASLRATRGITTSGWRVEPTPRFDPPWIASQPTSEPRSTVPFRASQFAIPPQAGTVPTETDPPRPDRPL